MTDQNLTSQTMNQALSLANDLARSLKDPERKGVEQRRAARALLGTMTTIFAFVEAEDIPRRDGYEAQIEVIASDAIAALSRFIQLDDDGYELAEVEVQLFTTAFIVEMLDGVIASSILSSDALERLSDQMHEQLGPTLCLVVRLMNPDKFEFGYVPDAFVQAGFSAMCTAGQLSRIISWADAKSAEGRPSGNLAA